MKFYRLQQLLAPQYDITKKIWQARWKCYYQSLQIRTSMK